MEYFQKKKSFTKTDIDIYSFIISKDDKQNIKYIEKLLDIKIPTTLLEDNEVQKKLYTNCFEVYFTESNPLEKKKLFINYGSLGVTMSTYTKKKIFIYMNSENENDLKNQIISYILGYFNFKILNTEIKKNYAVNITYFYHPKKEFRKIINDAIYTAIVQNEVRELINLPANILYSTTYLSYIKNNLPNNITLHVLDKEKLQENEFNLTLSVNRASSNPPLIIVLEYNYQTNENDKSICLIGKGVMFDTGGYNIKLEDFSNMKMDMAGSAVMYGVLKLLSHNKVKGKYIGILPIVQNMINGSAYLPGDVITAYNKKTIEIINTDAEGRLILAEGLSYSKKFNPKLCIDIGTLTEPAMSIFNGLATVVIGNTNKYIQEIIKEGDINFERVWQLPLWEEYIELTKSEIADLKNLSFNLLGADTVMCAAFLSNFVPKNTDWIHLDIAREVIPVVKSNYRQYGASGEMVRTIFSFLYKIST